MKSIVISDFCSRVTYNRILELKYRMGQQSQKYLRLICEGLDNNGISISTITVPPINSINNSNKNITLKPDLENNIEFNYIKITNVPILRNLLSFMRVLMGVIHAGKQSADVVFVLDLLNVTSTVATYFGARLTQKKILGILTDMPAIYVDNENSKVSFQKKLNQYLCMRCADGYLFVTEAMNQVVNIKNKPYVVIEGFSDIGMLNHTNTSPQKTLPKVCFYAGGINKLYGLDMLVKGFLMAKLDDCILQICGDGPYVPELLSVCKNNNTVKYLGVLDNNEVISLEEQAALLINPRYTDTSFTKYSFPSKNMEYMASGTPVLTTRLPGMPESYNSHVFLLDEETESGMANKLTEIFAMSENELVNKGQKAKSWILEEKNNIKGTTPLAKLIKKLIG